MLQLVRCIVQQSGRFLILRFKTGCFETMDLDPENCGLPEIREPESFVFESPRKVP